MVIGRQREKVRERVRVGPFPARGGTHHVLAGALTPLTSLRDGRSRSGLKVSCKDRIFFVADFWPKRARLGPLFGTFQSFGMGNVVA